MGHILFDIVTGTEPTNGQSSLLTMEIGAQHFSYALTDADKRLLHLRVYELNAQNYTELASELEAILDKDDLITVNNHQRTIIYNFPESLLVPSDYHDEEKRSDFLQLFHGDLLAGISHTEKLVGWDAYNIYQVPDEVHALLRPDAENTRYSHYYSEWIKSQPAVESSIKAHFYPNRVLISVIHHRQLQLLQSFNYGAAEDVAYYLLNVCSQLDLSPAEVPLKLSGMIDVASALYGEIYKYFGQVSLEDCPAAGQIKALQEYPPHFFSPLLNLAGCAS